MRLFFERYSDEIIPVGKNAEYDKANKILTVFYQTRIDRYLSRTYNFWEVTDFLEGYNELKNLEIKCDWHGVNIKFDSDDMEEANRLAKFVRECLRDLAKDL